MFVLPSFYFALIFRLSAGALCIWYNRKIIIRWFLFRSLHLPLVPSLRFVPEPIVPRFLPQSTGSFNPGSLSLSL